MKQRKLLVTMKDIQRYKVPKDVIDKKLKGSEAAHILGPSHVHISRLKKRLLQEGLEGLPRKSPAAAPHKEISIYGKHYTTILISWTSWINSTKSIKYPNVTNLYDKSS